MHHLILMGAGASAGSRFVSPDLPPVGNQLFDAVEAMGGIAAEVPTAIKQRFRANFEDGTAALAEHDMRMLIRFQKQLCRFLIQFRALPGNLYSSLVHAFGDCSVTYSTLNYDVIFETAIGDCSYDVGGSSPLLLKLHGSVDFWPDTSASNISDSNQIKGMTRETMHSGFLDARTIRYTHEFATAMLNSHQIGPVISSYAAGKPTLLCPRTLARLQGIWAAEAARAGSVHVIGTRVVPGDRHIWNHLSTAPGILRYFGYTETDCNEFREWAERARSGPWDCFQADFGAAIANISEHVRRRPA